MIDPNVFMAAKQNGLFVTDVNHDGNIDFKDLNIMKSAHMKSGEQLSRGDYNGVEIEKT